MLTEISHVTGCRETFPFEDMAQVATTGSARNFNPDDTERTVLVSAYSARYGFGGQIISMPKNLI